MSSPWDQPPDYIEKLLERPAKRPAGPVGECLDDELIAACAEGAELDPDEAEAARQHLQSCTVCKHQVLSLYSDLQLLAEQEARSPDELTEAAAARPAILTPHLRLRPVLIAAAFLLLAALATAGYHTGTQWLARREVREFWAPFTTGVTTVVIGNAKVTTLEGQERSDYVGTGDALALGRISHMIQALSAGVGELRIATTAQREGRKQDVVGAEVLIGGPTVNRLTLEYLGALRGIDGPGDPEALREGFRFVVPPGIPENAFARVGQPTGIEDVATGEVYAHGPDGGCALVVRGRVEGRDVLILAGYDTGATLAAMEALSQPGEPLDRLKAVFDEQGYAEMVLRAPGDGTASGIADFPTAANPRAASQPTRSPSGD